LHAGFKPCSQPKFWLRATHNKQKTKTSKRMDNNTQVGNFFIHNGKQYVEYNTTSQATQPQGTQKKNLYKFNNIIAPPALHFQALTNH